MRILATTFRLFAVAYVYGVFLGVIALVLHGSVRGGLPRWELWQYLLVPLGGGLIALTLEAIGFFIANGDDTRRPFWKRVPRLLVVFLFPSAVILGPVFYKIAHQ